MSFHFGLPSCFDCDCELRKKDKKDQIIAAELVSFFNINTPDDLDVAEEMFISRKSAVSP